MKRSEINRAYLQAKACFEKNGWALPPHPRWDVTDLGFRDFDRCGLVLINLAEEAEYCEKLMFAHRNQGTPAHCHHRKKEDIICRFGRLVIVVWPRHSDESEKGESIPLQVNGTMREVRVGENIHLEAGDRVTLVPGVYHKFYPESDECIIGEVSTANDDLNDNIFANPEVGRFPAIEEDEEPLVRLIGD